MSFGYSRRYFKGWVLFGMGLALIAHFLVASASWAQLPAAEGYTGRSPEALMEQFFEDAPDAIDPEILTLSTAGEYAIASYRWGEGGGFVVMSQQGDRQWESLCADGGAPNGGTTLVECGVPLVDAQALWAQFLNDSEGPSDAK